MGDALATFYRTSQIWVVDFLFDGRSRRWFKSFAKGDDAVGEVKRTLRQWYGDRARLTCVRPATEEEETQYLRGEEPRNLYCPTGRPGIPR